MDKPKSGAERRTAMRVGTHQHVIFSDHRAMGPLRTGTAVDRSTGGLRIVTAFPEAAGATIQIELQNSGTSGVVLLEGRVMHVVPTDNGLYAMGIRLASKMLRPPAPTRIAGGSAGPARAAMPARKLDVTVGVAGDTAAAAASAADREPVTFRRVEHRGSVGSWFGLIAILALVLILVLLILEAIKEERRNTTLSGPFKDSSDEVQPIQLAAPVPENDADGLLWEPLTPHEPIEDDATRMQIYRSGDAAFATVEFPVHAAAQLAPDATRASLGQDVIFDAPAPGRALSLDRFVNQLEYARESFGAGETGLGRTLVRRALRDGVRVPGVWREYAEGLLESFQTADAATAGPALDELLTFEPVNAGQPRPAGGGVRVDVDTGDHAMRVWRDGVLLAEFPVGLGRDGATPEGTFRIANKLTDPAWYPADGRVVPAGDPANPIGAQWMGLAKGERPTGIGIHPTVQIASIGRDASQGCVRMRPADAATLYRLVPIGTPVQIHD